VSGALVAAGMIGVTSGVYEACWSLLMTRHGANQWEIGVSWTLFALPFAALSRPAGWLADHVDRRVLAVGSLLWSLAFLASYPFMPGFVLLLVLGTWESLGFSMALPACQSLLGQGTAPERHGHAQGLFAASQTGATAVAAACAGVLFGIAPWIPFVGAATVCALLVAAVTVIWSRVPGRTPRSPAGTAAPLATGS
jgi:MFS transporter, DHA1 family, multidrug resistance protein